MQRTLLTAEVLVANVEYQIAIPPAARRIEFKADGFPVRCSFNSGEVAGANLAGFVVSEDEDIGMTGQFNGPVYYAAEQPHALLELLVWSTNLPVTSGGFDSGFDSGFDIGL